MTIVVVELAQSASRVFQALCLTISSQMAGDRLSIEGRNRCHC
jgi:hypothetical protein